MNEQDDLLDRAVRIGAWVTIALATVGILWSGIMLFLENL